MASTETPPPADTTAPPPPATTPAAPDAPGWERAVIEKLALATLQEQRAARRWRNFWRSVWLLLAGVVVWLLYRDVVPSPPTAAPHTAMIEVRGARSRR